MNVLLIYSVMIPSVRLCAFEILNHLFKHKKINLKCVRKNDLTYECFKNVNIVIFVRADSMIERYISKKLKARGLHCIYVLDDDLLNVPSNISSYIHYGIKSVKKNIIKIMNNCDTIVSPSDKLIEKYGKIFKYRIKIDEPTLVINEIRSNSNVLKIGFAGSIDRKNDFSEEISRAVSKIYMRYKDKVQFEFFGAKPDIVEKFNFKWIPYEECYEKYIQKIKILSWDIGLAPMPSSEFHKCKYQNKYIEYGSFGIIGIYSNVIPYSNNIINEQTGFLVENTEKAWFDILDKIISKKVNLIKIKTNIYNNLKNRYSIEIVSRNFFKEIEKNLKSYQSFDKFENNIFTTKDNIVFKFYLLFEKIILFIKRKFILDY